MEISREENRRYLSEVSVANLAALLDACVLLIGDYELVYQVVRSRFEEILTNEDYRVQLYSG